MYFRGALAIMLGVVMLAGGLAAVRFWSTLHAISPRTQPQDIVTLVHAQTDDPASLAYKIKHGQRINILLLGYGGPGHDGPYLTDSIMLLSIQPASRQAIMVSLPRDLYARIPALPNKRTMTAKLNSAYAIGSDHASYPNVRSDWKTPTGGGDLAAATVSQITGQPIDYWVAVDFKAFRDVVNALGGIRVDVPAPLDDPYFPAGETTGMMHIHFNPGWQQMNGEQALEYARSRETTSDFDRSRRQQLIMLAVRQRVFSLNAIPKMFSVLGALQDNVRTNLRPQDMRQLADLAGQMKDADIRRVAIDTTNFLESGYSRDGQYILQPLDLSYGSLQRYLAAVLPGRSVLARPVAFAIEDGSRSYRVPYGAGTPASITSALLQAIGLNASSGPASRLPVAQTEILDGSGGSAAPLVAWLQSYFGAAVKTVAAPSAGPAVTVVLGSDFTGKAFPYR
ncbi:MAG: LytR family transcriptional regulator [Chloroflexi bacterium]|nr:MAG: LytR family transcriptional regulator [Chloroflexota bacterium]